jgi:hypothetical protein
MVMPPQFLAHLSTTFQIIAALDVSFMFPTIRSKKVCNGEKRQRQRQRQRHTRESVYRVMKRRPKEVALPTSMLIKLLYNTLCANYLATSVMHCYLSIIGKAVAEPD